MLKMNQRMSDELRKSSYADKPLPTELDELATEGFEERNGCYFLRRLARNATNVSLRDFPDLTGYECFVNSVHIDDYVTDEYLSFAFKFADAVMLAWGKSRRSATFKVIISSDEFGAVVKGHLSRPGESFLAPELNGYGEAILVVDSTFEGTLVAMLRKIASGDRLS